MEVLKQNTKHRRADVEVRLVELTRAGPRLRLFAEGAADTAHSDINGLRAALIDLGPVFSQFGSYLGTRLDLLSESDARVLGKIDEEIAPLAPKDVWRIIRSELETLGHE